jgi:hypothetical protein
MAWPLWGKLALGAAGLLLLGGGAAALAPSSAMGNVHDVSDQFWQDLWDVANRLGTTPYVLGLLLFEESGLNPAAKNSIGCVGINQFCPGETHGQPDYSKGTYPGFVDIPVEQYLALSPEGQLPYVAKYWAAGPSGSLASARDVFWRSLLPATWKPNADPSAVVNDPAILGAHYAAQVAAGNPITPSVKETGVITAGDIDAYLASVEASPGWQYAMDRIAANNPDGSGAPQQA